MFPKTKKERSTYSLDDENKNLKTTLTYLKGEIDRLKKPPLLVCDVVNVFRDKAVVRLPNHNKFFVNVYSSLVGKIKAGDQVLVQQRSLAIVEKLDRSKRFDVEDFVILEKPKITWDDVGGLKNQIRELKEVIELPLKNPELFKKIGICPPKGILLYGPSGTGKTILAKAVAAGTNATFMEVVGSELVQKFIGEGAKLVKDIFKLAREKAPTIVFIDEIDSIAAERLDVGTSGEREVHRTFTQLLAELDGFEHLGNVKVIGATNRIDILDKAIIRPGRLDRLIEVPLPDINGRKEIFKIHSSDMSLNSVDFNQVIRLTEEFSGADIRAVCTEAGYFAIRNKRTNICSRKFFCQSNYLVKINRI
jgi:proteasome regulatory subunit